MLITWLAATASADCADLVDHLNAGVGQGAGARLARSEPWTQAELDCLVEAGVERGVVLAAARSSRLPIPDHLRPRWEVGALAGYVATRKATLGATYGGHLAYWPVKRVGVALTGVIGPDFGPDYKALRSHIDTDETLIEVTHVRDNAHLTVQLAPIGGELNTGRRSAEVLGVVLAGFGVALTSEENLADAGYLDYDTPDLVSAHPTLDYGLALVVAPSGPVGLRLQADQARWIETIDGQTLPLQRVQLAAALTWRP